MKHKRSLNERFLDIADWVSEYMGKPSNIIFWAVAVVTWTLLFALDRHLASANFLPAWFTSQAYNFPLNLITTVAELFIGFLVAAATNRAQRALTDLLNHIKEAIDKIEALDDKAEQLILENTELTKAIHDHVIRTDGDTQPDSEKVQQ